MMRSWIILVLLTAVAHAEDRTTAERYFRAGAKAYAAQNFQAAATNFDEAFKALPMPEIAFSAAQAYRRLYQVDPKPHYVRRAVDLYQQYLAKVKTGGRVGDAADNLADMKRELAKLEAAGVSTKEAPSQKAQTRIGINVALADQKSELAAVREIGDATGTAAQITATIDGAKVEPFALIEVAPKEHVVTVSADGYFPIEKKAVGIEGQSMFVDVELQPKPARLAVRTESDARISIDGRFVATAPTTALDVAAGKHLVTVLRRGREPFVKELTVTRGQDVALAASLQPTARRRAVPWLLGTSGVLLAGATTTGIFAVLRDQRATELRDGIEMGDRPASDADALDRAVSSRDRFVTWTCVLGGAAVVAGGVAGMLFYFDRPSAESATLGVRGTF